MVSPRTAARVEASMKERQMSGDPYTAGPHPGVTGFDDHLTPLGVGTFEMVQHKPTQIVFQIDNRPVLTIAKDGITAAPDVPVDDLARAVFRALEGYIKELK
jgi:hypothetical protein